MDHLEVLKRAWRITWRYRALWLFGVIVALTTSSGGGGAGRQVQYNVTGEDFGLRWGEFPMAKIPAPVVGVLVAVGVGLACVMVVMSIAAAAARYVAETALIRMVDDHGRTGERCSVRRGWRMGWSRAALRLFFIDLLIGLPVALLFILLFVLASAPLLLWAAESTVAGVIGTIATIGLFFMVILLAIGVGAVLSLLMLFFRRACALEGVGVIESIRQGYVMVRQHVKDVAVMWIIMIGLGFGWIILTWIQQSSARFNYLSKDCLGCLKVQTFSGAGV